MNPGSVTVSNVQVTGNTILNSMQKAIEIESGTNLVFDGNLVDGIWANSASANSNVSAIDIVASATGSVSLANNTLQNLTAAQTAFVNLASAAKYQASGMGNSGFDPTVAGPTPWGSGTHPSPMPIAVTSCTAPVLTDLGGGGSPADAGVAGSAQAGGSGNANLGGQGGGAGGSTTLPEAGATSRAPSAGGPGNASAGASGAPAASSDTGGCGCRSAKHADDSRSTALFWVALGAMGITRRKRARRAKQISP